MNSRDRLPRVRAILLAAAIALGLALSAPPAVAGSARSLTCRDVLLPVGLGDGQPATARIYGQLCVPAGPAPRAVQLLVHGAGYNHTYWSWPQDTTRYSYVRRAVDAGYATLAIDRLGVGRSTRPDSSSVNYQTTISTLHQVIQALRAGSFGPRFTDVAYVGHSFGSMYGLGEASTYQDVDAVLLTGSAHKVSPAFGAMVAAAFVPAATVAGRFAALDKGWLAANAGTVGPMHYYAPTADPKVIAYDEAHEEPVSASEFATRPPDLSALMARITVPVLVINGDTDIHYCAPDAVDCSSQRAFRQALAPLFPSKACVRTALVPQTGHDLTLHRTAPLSAAVMLAWSWQVLPPRGGPAGCPTRWVGHVLGGDT